MELDTVTASDAALTLEIGTSLTVETAIPVVAAAVTVRHCGSSLPNAERPDSPRAELR